MVFVFMISIMSNSDFKFCAVGDRIEYCGYFGTVKYVGKIKNNVSTWLGVDWDDPERGKHNGSVYGIQYFTTKYSTSGSFIRPDNVNFGKTAMSAIEFRYGQGEDDLAVKVNQQRQLLVQQSMNAPFLEMVGFNDIFSNQSNFSKLKVVNLRNQYVKTTDSVNLAKNCPNIEELDLSKNLLSNWDVVFELCGYLKKLYWINVSENIMSISDNYDNCYPHIKTLICGRMGLTWTDVVKISKRFSCIEEIVSPFNSITKIEIFDSCLKSLKSLDLEGNRISDWSEICKLGSITTLEQLNLEDIGLKLIDFKGSVLLVNAFKNLKKLCIVNNNIDEWKSINELNKLPNLEQLKISKNPLYNSKDVTTIHQLIIARIGKLKCLNGVDIEPNIRRGAEYDYIKKYGLEWLSAKGTPKETIFLSEHGRYLELIEKYGEPEESELTFQPKIIKNSLIQLNIKFNEKNIRKKLPSSITVQKLIIIIQKLFNLKTHLNLTYVSSIDPQIQIALNEDMKEIGFYSMEDEDQIIVNV